MENMVTTTNPFLQLQQFRVQKNKIDKSMQRLPKAPRGTVDFSYHKLKKESSDLQDKIRKIHSVLLPDSIA